MSKHVELAEWFTTSVSEKIGTPAWVLAYFHHRVRIGRLCGSPPAVEWGGGERSPLALSEDLVEIRVFSEQGDVHLWDLHGAAGKACTLHDPASEGETSEDHDLFLWGDEAQDNRLLEPGRGFALQVPDVLAETRPLPLRVRVRCYHRYDDDGRRMPTRQCLVGFLSRDAKQLIP